MDDNSLAQICEEIFCFSSLLSCSSLEDFQCCTFHFQNHLKCSVGFKSRDMPGHGLFSVWDRSCQKKTSSAKDLKIQLRQPHRDTHLPVSWLALCSHCGSPGPVSAQHPIHTCLYIYIYIYIYIYVYTHLFLYHQTKECATIIRPVSFNVLWQFSSYSFKLLFEHWFSSSVLSREVDLVQCPLCCQSRAVTNTSASADNPCAKLKALTHVNIHSGIILCYWRYSPSYTH